MAHSKYRFCHEGSYANNAGVWPVPASSNDAFRPILLIKWLFQRRPKVTDKGIFISLLLRETRGQKSLLNIRISISGPHLYAGVTKADFSIASARSNLNHPHDQFAK